MSKSGYYITPHGASSLHNFQYNGSDLSLIYKYILSPLAEFLVSLSPRWIAPNVITMFGMMWMIVSYLLIWYYCPNFSEGLISEEQENSNDFDNAVFVPRSIFLFNGLAMLIYQTLDNMDGKQARRTGSSSALGLLFDHGCDAFNSMLGSANWLCAMGVKPSELWQCAVILFCPMGAFYLATWEEYHTHKLILPVINGPSEGLIGGAILSIITFVYGVTLWHETSMWDSVIVQFLPSRLSQFIMEELGPWLFSQNEDGVSIIRNLDVVCLAAMLAFFQEFLIKIATVLRSTKSFSSLLSLFPFLTLVVFSIFAVQSNPNLFLQNPRTCLHLSCLLFTEMVTQLMLDHMTKEYYRWFRIVSLPFLLVFVLSKEDDLSYYHLFSAYTIGLAVYMTMKVRIVIWEISHILRIWCFDIVTPFPDEAQASSNGNGNTNDHNLRKMK